MFNFSSTGHAMAHFAQEIVTVKNKVAPILAKIAKSESTVEAITSIVDPQAVPLERAAYMALGKLLGAIDATTAAASASGLNIQLDQAEYDAFKDLANYLKSIVESRQIAIPAK